MLTLYSPGNDGYPQHSVYLLSFLISAGNHQFKLNFNFKLIIKLKSISEVKGQWSDTRMNV